MNYKYTGPPNNCPNNSDTCLNKMPRYPRKRRSFSYAKRRTPAKYARVSRPRRSYGKKRYGGKVTSKRIRNMMAHKKRDTYVSGAGEGDNPDPTLPVNAARPFTIRAGTTFELSVSTRRSTTRHIASWFPTITITRRPAQQLAPTWWG